MRFTTRTEGIPPLHDRLRARVDRLRQRLAEDGLACLIVFDLTNIRYLTGFSGSSAVVIVTPDEVVLFTDFRYRLRVREEAPLVRYVEVQEKLSDDIQREVVRLEGVIGVEEGSLSVGRWRKLEESLGEIPTRTVGGRVERLRMVKDPAEIDALRRAGGLVARTMAHLADVDAIGRAERDVALDLEIFARRSGSGSPPFDFIVAGGERGASPHAEATPEPVAPDRLLVVDIGVSVDGYASDMTRTFATGSLSDEEHRLHDLVLRAQEAARGAVKPGVPCSEIDAVARRMISEAGYGDCFRHSVGHGVGLAVHEDPRLSEQSEDSLEEGMVVTIEPGVYVAGLGGVRIEDTVLVTAAGAEVLTPWEHRLVTLA